MIKRAGDPKWRALFKVLGDHPAVQAAVRSGSEGAIKFILPTNTHDGQSFTLRSQWASESETLNILTVRLG